MYDACHLNTLTWLADKCKCCLVQPIYPLSTIFTILRQTTFIFMQIRCDVVWYAEYPCRRHTVANRWHVCKHIRLLYWRNIRNVVSTSDERQKTTSARNRYFWMIIPSIVGISDSNENGKYLRWNMFKENLKFVVRLIWAWLCAVIFWVTIRLRETTHSTCISGNQECCWFKHLVIYRVYQHRKRVGGGEFVSATATKYNIF